jgi:hypothetical protein
MFKGSAAMAFEAQLLRRLHQSQDTYMRYGNSKILARTLGLQRLYKIGGVV